MGLACAIVIQEDERWLRCDIERCPDDSGFIDGVREGIDPESVDEVPDGIEIVSSCDADELDVFTVLLVYLCDRRGFCAARASPWSPEPEHHVLPLKTVPVDLSPVGGRKHR